jgi:hypothetical protein
MSRENAEVFRRTVEAYNPGDLDGFLADVRPRVAGRKTIHSSGSSDSTRSPSSASQNARSSWRRR